MNVTRHISIDDEHFRKIKPYVEKYKGNLGAAVREMINQAGKYNSRMNSSAIDAALFDWMLKEIDGILVPDNILYELIDPVLINSMRNLEGYLNRRFCELGWDIDLALKCNDDAFPSQVSIEMKGNSRKIKFVASILSQYLVKSSLEHAPLEIRYVVSFSECIKVELFRSNKKEAQNSMITFFGDMNEIIRSIKSRPAFWKTMINNHLLSNYNMVTVHRNYFEDLLASKVPAGEIMIENLAKKPIPEIPLKEILSLIKEVYEASRVADRIDIDKDTVIVSHSYRNKEAIEKLKKSLVMLLEANGHLYNAKLTANMIILAHRPDVGIKINEIVDDLKTSSSGVDQALIMFMAFLEGFKDIPDVSLSLAALGRRFGKSFMQEYEREKGIKNWNLETFQKAIEIIDSRLHRESEWKSDGKNLLYTIKKCNIVADGNTFDTYVCHTARETFKGALNYAFGNKAELNIRKLLSHGDNFCEVAIRVS